MAITDIRKLREPVVLGRAISEPEANNMPVLPVPDIASQGPFSPNIRLGPNAPPASQSPFPNVFQTPQISPDTGPVPMVPPEAAGPGNAPSRNYIDRMKDFTPETAATDRFNELISGMPQREKPSIARRLVSSGVAIKHGYKGAEDVLSQPHTQAMADWTAQMDPAYQAANLERYGNVNERTLMAQMVNADIAEERNRIAEEKNKAAAEASMIRALAAQYKAKGWVIKVTGSRIVAVRPPDPSIPGDRGANQDLGDSRMMDQRELVELQNEGRIAAAEATGTQVFNTDEGTVRLPVRTPGAGAEKVEGVPPTGLRRPGTGTVQGMKVADFENIKKQTTDALQALDLVLDPETDTLRPEIQSVVGKSRILTWGHRNILTGTAERGAENKINHLKAERIVSLIAEMKNQSRTGATGFGQLTGPELTVLENAASRLDPAMSEEDFTAALLEVKAKLKKILLPPDGLNPTTVETPGTKPIIQRSPSTGRQRISTDGGKTWQPYTGGQ